MKQLSLLFILLLSIISVNSAAEYPIDEGFGSIIFDIKNPGFSGVGLQAKNVFWTSISKHGTSSVYAKPGKTINILINDYPQLTPISNFTFEFEYQPSTPLLENVFSKLGTYTFDYDGTLNTGTFTYYTGLIPHIIPILNITPGVINIIYMTWNTTDYQVYSNNISMGIFPDILPLDININPLNFFMNSFTGLIDEFEIYDRVFTLAEINAIVSLNQTIPGQIILPTNIIGTQFPTSNATIPHPVKFETTLLQKASCELYIDNSFEKLFSNTLAFTYSKDFGNNLGNHNYFYFCYTDLNLTQISQTINFNVTPLGVNSINFDISGTDFDINSIEMYLTTPCLKKGIAIPGINNGWNRQGISPSSVKFAQVINGQVTMTIPVGSHEFCLAHARIDYDTLNFTGNYKVNEMLQNLNLGEFNIPNNITQSFTISLDNFDIYKKTNPKAWGSSWVGLISSLLAFGLGLIILLGGMLTGSGQAVMIGGLLLLFSLGYQITNLILGVLI